MGLGPRLDLRTSQTLVISPQLQAAIRLLALSNLELQAEITGELERNPLLELADEGGDPGGEGEAAGAPETDAQLPEEGPPAGLDREFAAGDDGARGEALDVDLVAERFHHDSAADSSSASGPDDGAGFDQIAADEATLADVLARQAEGLPAFERAVALQIIAAIDDAGYLTEPLADIAARLAIPEAEVERVLALVQRFEPTGVGARSLAECIALQAKEADRYDPCMARLIDNLELVARGDLATLRRLCDVDAEDLADMLRELRSYDPKPGLRFGGGRTITVVPDIFVRRTPRGDWTVELNSTTLPRLVVNRQYQARIAAHASHLGGSRARPERQFLDQCLAQASWLMKALDQRAGTILKVAIALVEAQQGFFERGVAGLKPLTLRQLADQIGLHESTVSRVTSNKYLACDRGVFELKYFFTTAIHAAGVGANASAEAVRQRLKALIDAEEPLKPLSDDKLVELLKRDGYDLARRTVTKYREAMGIPSSFDRRRRALVKAA
ncbi:MAG: RNA polymerase factor sigma-54 [Sphingomonadaceae bacterium]